MKKPTALEAIRVVHFTDEHVFDPLGAREELSEREYNDARNHLLEICQKHGKAGPLDFDDDESDEDKLEDIDEDFWVVEDQLNYERYLYMEINSPKKVTANWLNDVLQFDAKFSAWGVCVTNIKLGYLIILPPVLLVMGPAFAGAKTGADCLKVLQMSLNVD